MCAARGVGGTYFFAAGLAKLYEGSDTLSAAAAKFREVFGTPLKNKSTGAAM